jgi:hypothetical protein
MIKQEIKMYVKEYEIIRAKNSNFVHYHDCTISIPEMLNVTKKRKLLGINLNTHL